MGIVDILSVIANLFFIIGCIISIVTFLFYIFFIKKSINRKVKEIENALENHLGLNIYNVRETTKKFEDYITFLKNKADKVIFIKNYISNLNFWIFIKKEYKNIKKMNKTIKKMNKNFLDNYKTEKEFLEKSNLLLFINIDWNKFENNIDQYSYDIVENKVTNLTFTINYKMILNPWEIALDIYITNKYKGESIIQINIFDKEILKSGILNDHETIKKNLEASLKEKYSINFN